MPRSSLRLGVGDSTAGSPWLQPNYWSAGDPAREWLGPMPRGFPRGSLLLLLLGLLWLGLAGAVPVPVKPVFGPHGLVVAGHPEAAQAGLEILQAGGNAVDAAVAVSLALGVAETYGSGLGGKLMLIYYEAATGKTHVMDAMDVAGSLDVEAYLRRPEDDHSYGYGAVCVPGLAAGLWATHQRFGKLPWADNFSPALKLARAGFAVLPKTHELFAEQEKKLRRGDAEIARLYLPQGELPAVGSRLANKDLAHTMELLAQHGRDGFYRGPVAAAIVAAAQRGGGALTLEDLAGYEVRWVEPVGITFRGFQLLSSPPPTSGSALFLTIMKVLEESSFSGGPLRSAANLDLLGRTWRQVRPLVQRGIGDTPEAGYNFEKMIAPDSIAEIRARVFKPVEPAVKAAQWDDSGYSESEMAATTHFLVADEAGNIVCATQSLSLHFGAGVVPPGTGVVLNNSMSNFGYSDPGSINYVAAGKRPRSTIAPTLVLAAGRPVLALGIPGSARIPTALLQVLLDRLALDRPLAEAIGDTRFHFNQNWRKDDEESIQAEQSLPPETAEDLRRLGWKVERAEPAGTGRLFGGINAIELNADGGYLGYADPRRTNLAVGY